MKGKIKDASLSFDRKFLMTFEISHGGKEVYEQFKEANELEIEVKKYRKKRSLDANAYAWKLITETANVLRAAKDEIYLKMLKRYGQSVLISVRDIAADQYKSMVKYWDEAGESVLNGTNFLHLRVYKGSSEFDTWEMSVFIDGIVSEAKELGIETLPPDEIARLKSLWQDQSCKTEKNAI